MQGLKDILSGLNEEEKKLTLDILKDLQKTGKSNLLDELWKEDYEEIPVSIDEFIDNPRYIGKDCTTIYPYWRQELRNIFKENGKYQEVALTGCLTAKTLIKMADGTNKAIIDIINEFGNHNIFVKCFDIETNKYLNERVIEIFDNGVKDVYKISFNDNSYIEATVNHQFLLSNKIWRSIDTCLSVGDTLLCNELKIITSIEHIGKQNTYDITVNKYHNFVLENNIIAHNSIGIGKSTIACTALAYVIYRLMCLKDPQKYYGIAAGSNITIAFFNITLKLTESVGFNTIQEMLMNSEWFMERGQIYGTKHLYYKPNKKIVFKAGSTTEHSLGQHIFAGMLDEVNFAKGASVDMTQSKIMKTYNCLHGETEILTDKGTYKISDLEGQKIKVYSLNKKGKITLSKESDVICTDVVDNLYEITLEDNTIIKCTPEHKFMLNNGKYKEAKDLTEKDILYENINEVNIFKIDTWSQFSIFSENNLNNYLNYMKDIYYSNRSIEDYFEIHHIMPKSFMINNIKVKLTAEEHFISHQMLSKCFSGIYKRKCSFALNRMCYGKNRYIPSAEEYSNVKKELKKSLSEEFKGRIISEESKKKMSKNHADISGENHPFFGKKGKDNPNFNRVLVHKDDILKKVKKNELQKYLNNGYALGTLEKNKQNISIININRIHIKRNGIEKSIKESELDVYLKDGWIKGTIYNKKGKNNPNYNKITMNNGINNKMVKEKDVEKYINLGYKLGRYNTVHNYEKICVNKNNKNEFININDLEKYISNGYSLGMYKQDCITTKDKILITNILTEERKFILNNSEIPDGWIIGNLNHQKCCKYIYIYDNKIFYGCQEIINYFRNNTIYTTFSGSALKKLSNNKKVIGYDELYNKIIKKENINENK